MLSNLKSFFKVIIFILPFQSIAQSTFIPQGSKEYRLIDRLEIKAQRNFNTIFSNFKSYNRKDAVEAVLMLDSPKINPNGQLVLSKLSSIDQYNIHSLFQNNLEWVGNKKQDYASKHLLVKSIYVTPNNFYEVNKKDFFLAVNPVLNFQLGNEDSYDKKLYVNSRGLTFRGMIANKIGFSSTLIDNQERGPRFFQSQIKTLRAVPGMGFYKDFKEDVSANDYFDARGYMTFNAVKYINFQLGYDKNFIGNGYRSLFLSDVGNSYLFAKINTKIWKFNYQNLFMELMPQFRKNGDSLLSRKYAVMHHLSLNINDWANIGLFEGVVFGRKNHFDYQYLNPIIFYRNIESMVGSPDNALAGLDFKLNAMHHFQFYGQFLLDEFILSKIKNSSGYWANKYGYQLGLKYIDAFGIKNLDIQTEINRVRPFTYSHKDSIANYTHYNQALAHPLGANFQEFIGIINYQPFTKWNIYAKLMYYNKGLDTANSNFGGDIFKIYTTRSTDYGNDLGNGNKATCIDGMLLVTYEFKQNLYFDLSLQHRNYKLAASSNIQNTTLYNAGVRLNLNRRNYDF
jgi:hypothetical protein